MGVPIYFVTTAMCSSSSCLFETGDGAWGLIEVYGEGSRRFAEEDVELVGEVARAASARLKQLEGTGRRG